jgi:hypothetical protein
VRFVIRGCQRRLAVEDEEDVLQLVDSACCFIDYFLLAHFDANGCSLDARRRAGSVR